MMPHVKAMFEEWQFAHSEAQSAAVQPHGLFDCMRFLQPPKGLPIELTGARFDCGVAAARMADDGDTRVNTRQDVISAVREVGIDADDLLIDSILHGPLTRSAIGSAILARIRQDECDIEARRLLRAINESCTVTRPPPSSDVTFRLTPSTATPSQRQPTRLPDATSTHGSPAFPPTMALFFGDHLGESSPVNSRGGEG
eukprot:CAMPEP_0179421986 /NCGR_PEP_ID=MMETSP0799-20121207/10143_1 /TAXON_ID=46947 /ORGANISM="Geminigera cryophila, Strain CCMP2564" /LENGTH=198 /DNA_ID=CAMNT_0021195999 /DNA_START=69 /DNA_END=662 /DNA_ORIENTATION=+